MKGQGRRDVHGVHALGRCKGKNVWFDCARESVGQWASHEDGLAKVLRGLLGAGGLASKVWAIGPWDWAQIGYWALGPIRKDKVIIKIITKHDKKYDEIKNNYKNINTILN